MKTLKSDVVGFRLNQENLIEVITFKDRQKMIEKRMKDGESINEAELCADGLVNYESHKVNTFLFNKSRRTL